MVTIKKVTNTKSPTYYINTITAARFVTEGCSAGTLPSRIGDEPIEKLKGVPPHSGRAGFQTIVILITLS